MVLYKLAANNIIARILNTAITLGATAILAASDEAARVISILVAAQIIVAFSENATTSIFSKIVAEDKKIPLYILKFRVINLMAGYVILVLANYVMEFKLIEITAIVVLTFTLAVLNISNSIYKSLGMAYTAIVPSIIFWASVASGVNYCSNINLLIMMSSVVAIIVTAVILRFTKIRTTRQRKIPIEIKKHYQITLIDIIITKVDYIIFGQITTPITIQEYYLIKKMYESLGQITQTFKAIYYYIEFNYQYIIKKILENKIGIIVTLCAVYFFLGLSLIWYMGIEEQSSVIIVAIFSIVTSMNFVNMILNQANISQHGMQHTLEISYLNILINLLVYIFSYIADTILILNLGLVFNALAAYVIFSKNVRL
jgi:hypothetical protein